MLFASKPQFLLLIFTLTVCLCFAKQQQAGDPDNGWNAYWYGLGVSGTFENGRNSIQADRLIKQMFKWGLTMNLVQFNTPEYRKSNQWYAPPISETNVNTPLDKFGKGTKYVILSWDDYMQSKQAQMNKGCGSSGTCTEDSTMFINWGTLDKMNFDKDGILIWFSGLVDIDIECDNFPDNCTASQIHLVEDHTFKYDQGFVEKGLITNIGQVNSLDDITKVMKVFSKNTNQHLTLPDGSST